jgi:hypothetical protein
MFQFYASKFNIGLKSVLNFFCVELLINMKKPEVIHIKWEKL